MHTVYVDIKTPFRNPEWTFSSKLYLHKHLRCYVLVVQFTRKCMTLTGIKQRIFDDQSFSCFFSPAH